jgi:hypothetical protein
MKSVLLGLLLLLAAVDDALACATPGAEDDALAAENNDFLAQPRSTGARLPQRAPSLPADRPAPPGRLLLGPARPGPRHGAPAPLSGPDLLYVLMSLQR